MLEELDIPEEEPEEEAELKIELEELGIPETEPEPEEPVVEKQITGQMTIEDILAEWENKKAETEAILEANAGQQMERKERVKQETAELMKLISGFSDTIQEDVQQILTEIDEEKKSQEVSETVVTEDDLPIELDIPEVTVEDEPALEDLDIPEEIKPSLPKRTRKTKEGYEPAAFGAV